MNKPTIRFDYTDDWEKDIFENIYVEASEGGTPDTRISEYYKNGEIPFAKIEDTEKKYIYDTVNHITKSGLNNSSAWIVPKDSVIFTNGATVGNVSINKIPISTKQGILGIVPKANYYNEFLYYLLSGKRFQKEVRMRIAKGTFDTIILGKLNEIAFNKPCFSEQEKIASFLSNIDSLIEEKKNELEKTKQYKEAMLYKMFPNEGSKVPEIRFKGFEGEWKIDLLSNNVTYFGGLTYSPKDIVLKNGTLVLRSSNVQNGELCFDDNVYVNSNVVNVCNVEKNDIIVVVRNGSRQLIGKHALVRKALDKTVIGAFMTGIKSDSPYFINALLSTQEFKKQISEHMGATINQITGGTFNQLYFAFPSKKEQEKIGLFFDNLDILIKNISDEINTLENYKATLLEKMFA